MVGGLTLVQPDLELAASLFDALSRATRLGRGIVTGQLWIGRAGRA